MNENKLLSIEVYWRVTPQGVTYGFSPSTYLSYRDYTRTVPIPGFILKQLQAQHQYSVKELAEAVWHYGDDHYRLMEQIEEKLKYNEVCDELYK